MRGFLSEGRRRGYALLPVPRSIEFGEGNLEIARLSSEPRLYGISPDNVAVRALRDALLTVGGGGEMPVELALDLGTVPASAVSYAICNSGKLAGCSYDRPNI